MAKLDGHVALVTGASQGIGRACARLLAEAGASVALCARNAEKLEAVAAEIASAGGQAATFRMDVASEDEVKAGVKAAIERFGKIDILVNNAGITRDQLVMRMKRADWDAVLSTNLTGAYLCTQAVVGSMLKQRWGRIINITSIFGQIGQAGQANYAASKAGLIGLTRSAAIELGPRNINVNAVAPGYIRTTRLTDRVPAEILDRARERSVLGRLGDPQDVANVVLFLTTEAARHITGTVIPIDGGYLL